MSTLVSKGIAPATETVLEKLRSKHPARKAVVREPTDEEVLSLRKASDQIAFNEDIENSENIPKRNENSKPQEEEEKNANKLELLHAEAARVLNRLKPTLWISALDVENGNEGKENSIRGARTSHAMDA